MLVPAPPAPPALPLAPLGAGFGSPTNLLTPAHTALRVGVTRLNVLDGSRATVTGRLTGAGGTGLARRTVILQALGSHGWGTVTHARTGARGRFEIAFTARTLGSRLVRVRFTGDPFDLASRRRLGTLNIYRIADASWYGGGGTMACGGTLTSSTLGVANKTLPCGTLVTLRYGGRSIRVPVVDRGPYVAGREFDLTEATKEALGFEGTGEVWSTR